MKFVVGTHFGKMSVLDKGEKVKLCDAIMSKKNSKFNKKYSIENIYSCKIQTRLSRVISLRKIAQQNFKLEKSFKPIINCLCINMQFFIIASLRIVELSEAKLGSEVKEK